MNNLPTGNKSFEGICCWTLGKAASLVGFGTLTINATYHYANKSQRSVGKYMLSLYLYT